MRRSSNNSSPTGRRLWNFGDWKGVLLVESIECDECSNFFFVRLYDNCEEPFKTNVEDAGFWRSWQLPLSQCCSNPVSSKAIKIERVWHPLVNTEWCSSFLSNEKLGRKPKQGASHITGNKCRKLGLLIWKNTKSSRRLCRKVVIFVHNI